MLNLKKNCGVIIFYMLIVFGTFILINDTKQYEQKQHIIVKK